MGKKSGQKKKHAQSPRPQSQPVMAANPQVQARREMSLSSLGEVGGVAVKQQSTSVKPLQFGEQIAYVRGDIIRILMLLAIVALLLVTAILVNNKSSLLQRAGHKTALFMRLQQ
jgi:hypothetical protein